MYIINSCHQVYGAICIVIKAYFVTEQHLRAANQAASGELIEITILGEIAVNCARAVDTANRLVEQETRSKQRGGVRPVGRPLMT